MKRTNKHNKPIQKSETPNTIVEELHNAINTRNQNTVQKLIFKIDISILEEMPYFTAMFVAKFRDTTFVETIFGNIIDKISDIPQTEFLQKLQANALFYKAKSTIKIFANTSPEVKIFHYIPALLACEKANAIYRNNLEVTNDNTKLKHYIKSFINQTISTYSNSEEAFTLAQQSLEYRQEYLEVKDPSILDALITAATIGTKLEGDTKTQALVYAEKAYNMATELGLEAELISALKCMADIYEFFGDILKAEYLLKQARELLEIQEEGVLPLNVIKKHGIINENELHLKEMIQVKVLNEISKAAANGKWFDKQLIGEYGVTGYLNEKYLTTIIGAELATPENMQIVLALCFEAINHGIMKSPEQNPLCATIFVQKYPEIIEKILEIHPEYFVDGFILQTTLLNAHEYSKVLVGHLVPENTSYNQAFETAIMPFIEARLQDSVFTPITTLITKGEWSRSIEEQLLGYFDEEYLTTAVLGNSYLGKNLYTVPDVMSIVKILGFKAINSAIKETHSTNYTPAQTFIAEYPELTARIAANHKDYFANDEIIRIYQKIENDLSLAIYSNSEDSLIEIISAEDTVIEDITVLGDS